MDTVPLPRTIASVTWNLLVLTVSVITIRCTRSRGPRDFFCLQDIRRGPVNVAVITLNQPERKSFAQSSPRPLNQHEHLTLA